MRYESVKCCIRLVCEESNDAQHLPAAVHDAGNAAFEPPPAISDAPSWHSAHHILFIVDSRCLSRMGCMVVCVTGERAHIIFAHNGALNAQLLPEFIHDHRDAAAVLRRQNVTHEGGLPRAQESCKRMRHLQLMPREPKSPHSYMSNLETRLMRPEGCCTQTNATPRTSLACRMAQAPAWLLAPVMSVTGTGWCGAAAATADGSAQAPWGARGTA